MPLRAMLVLASLFTVTAWDRASAQAVMVTAGLGRACHGTDGSVCGNSSAVVTGTVGIRLTRRLAIGVRLSQFENAFTGETSYYAGLEPREVARLSHETGRTMKYGAELLFYPSALAGGMVSAFVGGGAGVRTFQHRTTCAFGACSEPGPYAVLVGTERVRHGYVGFVAGVDGTVGYGLVVRGTVRLDDFPSEVGAAQVTVELGYRFGAR
jgi:hypothetical protein